MDRWAGREGAPLFTSGDFWGWIDASELRPGTGIDLLSGSRQAIYSFANSNGFVLGEHRVVGDTHRRFGSFLALGGTHLLGQNRSGVSFCCPCCNSPDDPSV